MTIAAPTNGRPRIATQRSDKPAVRIIPFDHVASFSLVGRPGELHQDVLNIGVEGVFVAVAIGYGLTAEAALPVNIAQDSASAIDDGNSSVPLGDVKLANLPPHVLVDGLRINPTLDALAFAGDRGELDSEIRVNRANRLGILQTIEPFRDFSFLFNIIDTGSGRELQNAPIHSVAGLGQSNGERPFRMLAKPLTFLPRSTVRIEVEEQTRDVSGRLFVVLHGYNILGAGGIPEEQLRVLYHKAMEEHGLRRASSGLIHRIEERRLPSRRLVPFDYVGTLDLVGRPSNIVETEVNINVDGRFIVTSVGYSLSLRADETNVGLREPADNQNQRLASEDLVDVGGITLSRFPPDVLRTGFRIRPTLLRLAFSNGTLSMLPPDTVSRLFERLNLPDRVQFLYSIEDTGTGRPWQNQPVHNIAGLGVASGDRPFRQLAWPMNFLPRSTIRIRVEEIFGRGKLFIVFQGYKITGGS